MNILQKKFKGANRGAVFLIAMLVASVALSVGFGVYNRTYKELLFASFWKQAQTAFSAADSGLECALYWDLKATSPAMCFGQTVSTALWVPGNAGSFQADTITGSGCVKVEITVIVPVPPDTATRKISAKGYNASCFVVVYGTNPRLVERGLSIDY